MTTAGAHPVTPIDPARPAVLVHARGRLDADACGFWGALRRSLRQRGAELLLIAHHWPGTGCDLPVLRVRNGLDTHVDPWPDRGWAAYEPAPPVERERELLEREDAWRGPARDERQGRRRREGLGFVQGFYADALRRARPRLCVIWNGQHAQELLLADLCARIGTRTAFVERGPFPGTIHLDDHAVLGGSAAARARDARLDDPDRRRHWLGVFDRLVERQRRSGATWWDQPPSADVPALRRRLELPAQATVVLFAGQVDQDVQNLLHAPGYAGNVEAFGALLDALPRDDPRLVVVGKHHPKSTTPPEAYRRVIERAGAGARWRAVWLEDLALPDALAIADRVAAVNSTVLYEALARARPTLMLGRAVLSGKDIAWACPGGPVDHATVGSWLAASDLDARLERFRDFGAWMLAAHLFAPSASPGELRGPDELASWLLERLASEPPRLERLPLGRGGGEEVALWDEAREARDG